VVRASHARFEIRSMALEVLPEDQSKIPENLQITLTPVVAVVVVEVEVALEAVAVAVKAVALEVEAEEVPNDSASRDE
jgi:TATA-box binding protein (TBP) (component of TFIID and TFIIIB)